MPEKIENAIQFIDIDLEQWRREINTFATTTQRALDAITDELSNACNGGHAVSGQSAVTDAAISRELPSQPLTKRLSKPPASKTKPAAISQSTLGDDRLVNIKEKLAQRLAKAKYSTT